jgi:hypothetical protein
MVGHLWGCSLAADPDEDDNLRLQVVRRWHSFGLCQEAYGAADP